MTATPACNLAGCSFELSQRDLHVFSLPSTAPEATAARFEPLLSADETERAGRFRFEHLRRSYIVTRGCLRCLLGRYLHLSPASLQFHYGPKGKPSVDSAARLQFNTTHSHGLAAFAFTLGVELGLDVEQIRPMSDAQDIAQRFFCPEEAAEILSMPPGESDHGFFRCWTRKEAYIKAIGDGLSAPLDDFRVTIREDETPAFIYLAGDTDAAKGWTLHDLSLDSAYAAALAYQGPARSVSIFRIADPAVLL